MGDQEPGLGAGDGLLPVLGQSSASSEPGKGAFDDPSPRQEQEAFGAVGAIDDLQGPVAELGELPVELWAGVGGVSEEVAQPWKGSADRLGDHRCAVAILDAGGMDDEADQQAEGVGDDVTLAPVDLFARIVAANTAVFRGLDALAVDDAGRVSLCGDGMIRSLDGIHRQDTKLRSA